MQEIQVNKLKMQHTKTHQQIEMQCARSGHYSARSKWTCIPNPIKHVCIQYNIHTQGGCAPLHPPDYTLIHTCVHSPQHEPLNPNTHAHIQCSVHMMWAEITFHIHYITHSAACIRHTCSSIPKLLPDGTLFLKGRVASALASPPAIDALSMMTS